MRTRFIGAALLVGSMLLSNVTAFAAYSDVNGYSEIAIKSLVEQGALPGQGQFSGANPATRGFVIQMLVKGMKMDPVQSETPTFKDVPKTSSYYGYIEAAAKAGWIAGYMENGKPTGMFKPENNINRAELMKIVVEAYKLEKETSNAFSDVDASAWFSPYVNAAYRMSIVDGFKDANGKPLGIFGPGKNVIRQDVAVVVYNSQHPKVRDMSAIVPPAQNDTPPAQNVSGDGKMEVKFDTAASDLAKADYKNARGGEGYYTGSFPAGEGTVVKGTAGLLVNLLPSGSGKYQFVRNLWNAEPLACRDGVRTVQGSTGKAFEDAYYAGFAKGKAHGEALAHVYDDSVEAKYSAQSSAYKAGYAKGFDGNVPNKYGCTYSPEEIKDANFVSKKMAGYDNDGWLVYAKGSLKDITFGLAAPISIIDNYPKNPLFIDAKHAVYAIDLFANKSAFTSDLNASKGPTKIDRIFFNETVTDETDPKNLPDLKKLLEESYDAVVQQKAVGSECQYVDPRNSYWKGKLTADYDGKAFKVEDYTAGSVKGLKLTTYKACFKSGVTAADQINYLSMAEKYFFLTSDKNFLSFGLEFDGTAVLTGDASFLTLIDTIKSSDFYDAVFLTQFFSKMKL